MANVVKYNARVTMKSDTKTNWDKATSFIPLKGEIIHYSDLNKIKIGDGTTYVTALKFIAENEIATLDADIQDAIDELRESTESSISAINTRYNNTIAPAITKANNAVLYTAQTLTDAQKEQARKNIGLFSSSASNTVVDIKVKEATKADTATNATNATNAKEAEHADTADSASQAGHASSADEAVHATTADAAILAATAETADQAGKLTVGDIGSTKQPVYFDNGVPVGISYTIEKSVPADAKFTDTDTKVTSVGNHYTPSKSKTLSASSTSPATWGNTDLITGIEMDAKGHVTGVTSIQMPSNPDKNQTVKGNGTSFGANDSVDFLGNGVITITPSTANKTITVGLTEDTSHRFVTDAEKESWNGKATTNYVDTKVAGLIDSAPGTLDTLNELAAALGDDPNFATTMATEIGKKADKTTTITAGNGLTGGGSLASNRTISHADTSSQSSITASGRRYITGVTLDEYGHVTKLTTGTETVIDTNTTYTFATGNTNGAFTVTPSGSSTPQIVNICGLGSLAYKDSLSASDVGALTREEIIALIQEAIEPYAILYAGTTVPASSLGENGDVYIQH